MDSNSTGGTTAKRIERQLAGARLRVLIIGAGIAGATLGALLRRRGEPAAIIERSDGEEDGGYMLGLMPLGGRVLNGLGLAQEYEAGSLPVRFYILHDRHGQKIRRYPLAPLVDRFGSWRGIERGVLLRMLRQAAGPIEYGTVVEAIDEDAEGATATFHDGSKATFDLIVGADGIHSATRGLILAQDEVEDFDTGWGGFVVWSALDPQEADTYRELWSAGWGVGIYPVPGRCGIFFAGRHQALKDREAQEYAETIEKRLPAGPFRNAVAKRDRSTPAFYWKMADCRARTWSRGRTLLLGDAAAAFLPTAGVGASAAMDSAAALADELSRADVGHMDYALQLYEKRQRRRVELAQKNSRNLARYMFVNSGPMAWARDQFMRFYSLERLMRDISKVMEGE
ncbi:FAD-dependent oxidoreductase [Oceanidesulfovibrio marinus]|uniref:FAD-dependent monooxygenase n=1 Tax=Oceanidesulfovibrio marinus TaxID=370038 RepID=A0A6P1Z9W1_9BACT|nr:NAD(P)/FAD-dependent oxidoreductase [Oceanidesulfovibrio marinus]TVM30319.1 FAD-dependent monooxygenase [Oceanidesulfovibrio marinus]